jgi:tRNA/tmRNA/rRNA uracil-C5-methylase (TrmA/RlmC/RlmD family)
VRAAGASQFGDTMVDLYAGAGLFSVLAAHDVETRGRAQAVERDRRGCADAEYNGRDLPQLRLTRASSPVTSWGDPF